MDSFAAKFIRWHEKHGRHHLPWQHTRDPYAIWLSEIMLQQTQVNTVIPYYQRFLQSFPDIRRLALASLDDVLARWSGLGYYSRGRNLHRAARMIVSNYQGKFPESAETICKLPGNRTLDQRSHRRICLWGEVRNTRWQCETCPIALLRIGRISRRQKNETFFGGKRRNCFQHCRQQHGKAAAKTPADLLKLILRH